MHPLSTRIVMARQAELREQAAVERLASSSRGEHASLVRLAALGVLFVALIALAASGGLLCVF